MSSTTTKKIIIGVLATVFFFAVALPKTTHAYDASQRQADLTYVNNHIGTAHPYDLGTTVASALTKYTALRNSFNLVDLANKKIQSSNASQADKATSNQIMTNLQADMTGATASYNKILLFKQQGTAMQGGLANNSFNIPNCYTANGIFGSKTVKNPDGSTESTSYCGATFNSDILTKAYTEYNTYLSNRDFLGYQVQIQAVLAKNSIANITQDEQAAALAKAQDDVPKSALEQCVDFPTVNIGICVKMTIGWVFYAIAMMLAGIMTLAGTMLDGTITYTIINLKTNLDGIGSIGSLWIVFRDIANLSFIFLLLYVAVSTILQVNGVNWKKTLVQIVIAAILINFSLFITKIILDFSNIIALAFYNKIGSGGSISTAFMNMLGLESLIKGADGAVQTWSQDWLTLVISGLGTIVVFFVATFSFIAALWLFLFRYAVIILLMIVSPLAFAARAFPQLDKQFTKWWNALMGQALFPIIYMALIWLTITVGNNLFNTANADGTPRNLAAAFALSDVSNTSAPSTLIKFVVIIILMNVALALATSQASRVGGRAENIMKGGLGYVNRFRDRTRAGAVGVAQRNLVNKPIRATRNAYNRQIATIVNHPEGASGWAKEKARNLKNSSVVQGTGRLAGRIPGAQTATRYATGAALWTKQSAVTGARFANKAFDKTGIGALTAAIAKIPGVKTTGNLTGAAARGVGRGAGNLATFAGTSAMIGIDRSINSSLKAGEDYKAKGTENQADYEKYTKGRMRDLKEVKIQAEQDRKLQEATNTNLANLDTTNATLIEEIQKLQKGMSGKDLEDLYDKHPERLSPALLANLDQSKFDTFLKSDKANLTEEEKKRFRDQREGALLQWSGVDGSGKALPRSADSEKAFRTFISKKKSPDIAELPAKVLAELANQNLITGSDLDQIFTKGTLSTADRQTIRQNIEGNYQTALPAIDVALVAAKTRLPKVSDEKDLRLVGADITNAGVAIPAGLSPDQYAESLEKLRRSAIYLSGAKGGSF